MRVGEEEGDAVGRGEETARLPKLSSVCSRCQLEDDGVLKFGDPKATARASRGETLRSGTKGAGGIYAELETDSEKQR